MLRKGVLKSHKLIRFWKSIYFMGYERGKKASVNSYLMAKWLDEHPGIIYRWDARWMAEHQCQPRSMLGHHTARLFSANIWSPVAPSQELFKVRRRAQTGNYGVSDRTHVNIMTKDTLRQEVIQFVCVWCLHVRACAHMQEAEVNVIHLSTLFSKHSLSLRLTQLLAIGPRDLPIALPQDWGVFM